MNPARLVILVVASAPLFAVAIIARGAVVEANPAAPAATTSSAAATVALTPSATPLPKETETLPPTPGPDTPTPALPEEGGPAGGVLGGHLYSDDDGDGKRSAGDSPAITQVLVDRILSDSTDLSPRFFSAVADLNGYWEVRSLADGRYRVSWAPPLNNPADFERSIPPPTDVVLNPEHTVRISNVVVEIVKANRILDIDFGMPLQSPVFGAPAPQLPNTGGGASGGVSANEIGLFAGLAASALLALGLAAGRRRSAHR